MPTSKRIKLILLTSLFLLLSVSFFKSAQELAKNISRLDNLRVEVAITQKKRDDLKNGVEFKKTNEYIEERARTDLNLIKPGEKVYVVVPDKTTAKNTNQDTVEKEAKASPEVAGISDIARPNWYYWYKLVF